MDLKLTVSNPKTGKSVKKDLTGKEADEFLGKDLGDTVSGDVLGFAGYEFKIMGGSDHAGFPMRKGLKGVERKRIFTYRGVGFSGRSRHGKMEDGLRIKRMVFGQRIGPKITQVNLVITKEGAAPLFEEKKAEEVKQ
jgi:small subunit ribosomal protein S6e